MTTNELTIGDVLTERRASGRLLRLWRTQRVAGPWVGEAEDRTLWQWPAEDGGWSRRTACALPTAALVECQPYYAAGTGWPGLMPPL